jgi:hypothetical protein
MDARLTRNFIAASQMEGQIITRVTYLRLSGPQYEQDTWDFGEWHFPSVGVELETSSAERFYAIWDANVTQYDLTFARGPISEQWYPLQADSEDASGLWEVTDHPRWRPLVGVPITRVCIAVFDGGWGSADVPHAVRLATAQDSVWILAAEPNWDQSGLPPADLRAEDIHFYADEIMVVFGDERAEMLGIPVAQVLAADLRE